MGYFKNSAFDPKVQLAISYKGQSAVDAGGVVRQFYTDVIEQLQSGCQDIPQLLEGKERRKLPVHNADTVLSGLMEIVEKIIAHSIAQTGVGVSCLSPAVYAYM